MGLACGKLVGSNRPPAKRVAADSETGGLAKVSRGEASYAPHHQPTLVDAGPAEEPALGLRYGNYQFEHDVDYRPSPYPYEDYRVLSPLPATGTVTGRVIWPKAPTIESTVTTKEAGCPGTLANRTLSLGDGRAVAGAIVYIDDIEQGRPLLGRVQSGYADRHFQLGGIVEWQGCHIEPRVQLVAPVGSVLTASSIEPVELDLVRVHGSAREVADHITLAGSGAIVERMLYRAGFYRLERSESDSLAQVGWIAVARHPYYAVTDASGRFSLEQIPPGRYTLVAWHPPVLAAGAKQAAVPIVTKRTIAISANRSSSVQLQLPATR